MPPGSPAACPVAVAWSEREVEVVLNRRLKRQGMRWRRANADAVVAVRVRECNATWDKVTANGRLAA
jgi:hypothetical protein